MSAPEASDADLKEAVVSSPATDPVEALRDALSGIAGALARRAPL